MCARRVDACCERCEDILAVGRGWLCALAGWLERKGRWRSNLSARACCLGETGSTEGAACFSGTFCAFFDASVVRYPSSYTYPTTYETRSLTAVAGYIDGTSMFTTLDISSSISSWRKYSGGVLGPNGLIYFIPYNADHIGILNPSSNSFSTLDISSFISSGSKYYGGVLGPNGLIYFIPRNADHIGILHLGNTNPSYEVSNCIPPSWTSLLSPHFNKF